MAESGKITLAAYVLKRNGVPFGDSRSLSNNLYRSLGAPNFKVFWNYWNPVFGYYLGYYIFKPLRRYVSAAIALMATFLFCGLIHDFVSLIFIHKTYFLFSFWFLFMSIGVLLAQQLKYDFTGHPWTIRAIINLFLIGLCFALAYYFKKLAGLEINIV